MKILIVGGGIAGLTIALELIKNKVECVLIDNGTNHSTLTAAGMINPIVFRRTTKSWRVDEFIPFLTNYYQNLELETNETFFYPLKLRRIFSSQQEREEWLKRETQAGFQDYLELIEEIDNRYSHVHAPFGTGRVKQCYWVDSKIFMTASMAYIQKEARIIREDFDYHKYDASAKKYKGEFYDKIIFCEGYQIKNNPLFFKLPIGSTKGQILTILTDTISQEESLNRKCFVLPIGGNKFRIGSTYEWEANDLTCTDAGKNEILANFGVLTNEIPEIVEHSAGIRPTSIDRRPAIGEHPTFRDNYVFNGLGTKGYMIAPLLAHELSNHILQGKPLHKEVILDRFSIE